MFGFGLLLGLTGLVLHSVAGVAWCSKRVRLALPLPVESSPLVLTTFGHVCEIVGARLTLVGNSWQIFASQL